MADTTPSQDPRKAFEHHCKTIGIDGSALERWEDGQYMRSHVQLMWQAYQWRADAAPQPNAAADGCAPLIARARDEWHEEDGAVMWWAWCGHGWAGEPAWCGTPLCTDWPGYHTHWTPHPAPPTLNASEGRNHGQ